MSSQTGFGVQEAAQPSHRKAWTLVLGIVAALAAPGKVSVQESTAMEPQVALALGDSD